MSIIIYSYIQLHSLSILPKMTYDHVTIIKGKYYAIFKIRRCISLLCFWVPVKQYALCNKQFVWCGIFIYFFAVNFGQFHLCSASHLCNRESTQKSYSLAYNWLSAICKEKIGWGRRTNIFKGCARVEESWLSDPEMDEVILRLL